MRRPRARMPECRQLARRQEVGWLDGWQAYKVRVINIIGPQAAPGYWPHRASRGQLTSHQSHSSPVGHLATRNGRDVCCQIIAAGRSCQIPHDGRQDHRDGAGSRGQFKTNLKFNEFIKKSVTALSKHNLPTFRLLLMACQIS